MMMLPIILVALEVAVSAPIPLWGPLYAGMSKEQVKATQPGLYVSFAPQCGGLVEFRYERRRLSAVHIKAYEPATSNCGTLIQKSLMAKYGKPSVEKSRQQQSGCGFGTLAALCRAAGGEDLRTDDVSIWVTGKTRVTLTSHDGKYLTVDYDIEPLVTPESINPL